MINALSQASALNPGSDLWVVTDLRHSQWTSKIDWYLNLQIVKASRHQSPQLAPFLVDAMEKTGLGLPDIPLQHLGPLLIQSESLLPNKWVLVLPYTGELRPWVEQASKIWKQLQKPTLRLFLPAGQKASSIEESWIGSFGLQEISVVLDLSH